MSQGAPKSTQDARSSSGAVLSGSVRRSGAGAPTGHFDELVYYYYDDECDRSIQCQCSKCMRDIDPND